MILTVAGSLYVFGSGSHGQLGFKNTSNFETPQKVSDFSETRVVKIAAGWNHSLVLTEGGLLYSTGHGEYG